MSLLADPDVTGSIEPSADWEPCSFGSTSEDTLGGWALILVLGIFPNLGSEEWTEDKSDFPFINLLPSVYTECRLECLMQLDRVRLARLKIFSAFYLQKKTNPLLLNEHQYLMTSPRR